MAGGWRWWIIELEFPRSHEADIIVPTKAVTELQRLLTDEGEVKVSVGSGQIAFDLNNTLLVSKLIEGNYPNYKQVIPAETKERVTLERETFLNSLRRVSLLASDKSNSIKLNFTKNNIDITANTPEVGEAKESLAVAYKGRDFSIAFNPEFFMAPLRQSDGGRSLSRSDRRDEPGRAEDSDAVSLRADADAHQFVRFSALVHRHPEQDRRSFRCSLGRHARWCSPEPKPRDHSARKAGMHFAPTAAAMWEIPLSCPRKSVHSSRRAARRERKFFGELDALRSASAIRANCFSSASPPTMSNDAAIGLEKRLRDLQPFFDRPIFCFAPTARMKSDDWSWVRDEKLVSEFAIRRDG